MSALVVVAAVNRAPAVSILPIGEVCRAVCRTVEVRIQAGRALVPTMDLESALGEAAVIDPARHVGISCPYVAEGRRSREPRAACCGLVVVPQESR